MTRNVDVIVFDGLDNSTIVSSEVLSLAENDLAVIDLNGDAEGVGFSNTFFEDGGPVAAVDPDAATIVDVDSDTLASGSVQIFNPLDGASEVVAVDVSGTNIAADFDSVSSTLILTGVDSVVNYEQVLRTPTYNNTSDTVSPSYRSL